MKNENGQKCDPKFKIKHGQNIYEVWDDTRPSGRRTVVETYFENDPAHDDYEPTRTQQQFKDDCDVNIIMEKYAKIGLQYSDLPEAIGAYADLTGIGDYKDMLDRVRLAEEAFKSLPAKVKSRFDQDPAKLISFLESTAPDDINESYTLGLRQKPTAPPLDPMLEEIRGLRSDLKPAKPKKNEPAEE